MLSTFSVNKSIGRLIVLAVVFKCLIGNAQTESNPHRRHWNYQVGIDTWHLDASVDKDPLPGYNEANSNLLLPNSYTQWQFKQTSPFGRVTGTEQLSRNVSFNFKAKADQSQGIKVNEASFQKDISPSLALRVGVVDYKTSWCRTYDTDNGWIQDIEAFCVTPQFRDVSGGAPGLQAVTNTNWKDYQIQTLAGIYNPLLFNYAPKEFGNVVPSPQYSVTSNKKTSLNLNVLDLMTSLETRISYIHTDQAAYSPETNLRGTTKQAYDLLYFGLNVPTRYPDLSVRLTHVLQNQKATCRSSVAQLASRCNLNATSQKHATSIHLSYRHTSKNLFSLGVSETEIAQQADFFTPDLQVFTHLEDQFYIRLHQASAAWRRDWGDGFFAVGQFIKAKQTSGQLGIRNPSEGYAFGIRLGYQY